METLTRPFRVVENPDRPSNRVIISFRRPDPRKVAYLEGVASMRIRKSERSRVRVVVYKI